MTYKHQAHPHVEARKAAGPSTTHAARKAGKGWLGRIGASVGLRITLVVGTMTCAFLFMCVALVSLPSALKSGNKVIIVAWISGAFLQLVLLPIIIVGQNVQSKAADARAADTFKDAEAILHELGEVHRHLDALKPPTPRKAVKRASEPKN